MVHSNFDVVNVKPENTTHLKISGLHYTGKQAVTSVLSM